MTMEAKMHGKSLTGLAVLSVCCMSLHAFCFAQDGQIARTKAFLKVTQLRDNVGPTNQYISPSRGYRFIGVEVTLDNRKGVQPIPITPMDFRVKDAKGRVFGVHIGAMMLESVQPPVPDEEQLEPGDLTSGWLAFQVPADTKLEDLRLRYETFELQSKWIPLILKKGG
jgi:hypothetical protein